MTPERCQLLRLHWAGRRVCALLSILFTANQASQARQDISWFGVWLTVGTVRRGRAWFGL